MKLRRIAFVVVGLCSAAVVSGQNAQNGVRGIRGVTRRTPTVVYGQNAAQFFAAGGVPLNSPTNGVAGPGAPQGAGGAFVRRDSRVGPVPANTPQWAGRPAPLPAGGQRTPAAAAGSQVPRPAAAGAPVPKGTTNLPSARR